MVLQLWLNTTFEPCLKTKVPPSLEVGFKGIRLATLTHDARNVFSLEIFEDYFQIFYRCKSFI